MSSAIEVLKNGIAKMNEANISFYGITTKELSEALLALEQKEKLKTWLEKRIEANQKRYDWQLTHLDMLYGREILNSIEQRIVDYKEVLGELQ